MALINCKECKKKISDQAISCPACGVPVNMPATSSVMITAAKSRSLAILLAMLGGSLGLQKFYLNRPGAGVLCIVFIWTAIPLILGFLEGLSYLSMSDQVFQQKYEEGLKGSSQNPPSLLSRKPNEASPILEWAGWFLLFVMINGILSVSTINAAPNVSILVLPAAFAMTFGIRWLYKKKVNKAKV